MEIKPKPILTEAATILFRALATGKTVFEFGSGGSTLWLSGFVTKLHSIEDNQQWYNAVQEALINTEIPFILQLVATKDIHTTINSTSLWDIVFVDCLHQISRINSIRSGSQHVKLGGWLIADDYNFPKVKQGVDELKGWNTSIVSGIKIHPIKQIEVFTSTAFCHKMR